MTKSIDIQMWCQSQGAEDLGAYTLFAHRRKSESCVGTLATCEEDQCSPQRPHLQSLPRIAPSEIRRYIQSRCERHKRLHDERHPLLAERTTILRLSSRRSFFSSVEPLAETAETTRIRSWCNQPLSPYLHSMPCLQRFPRLAELSN